MSDSRANYKNMCIICKNEFMSRKERRFCSQKCQGVVQKGVIPVGARSNIKDTSVDSILEFLSYDPISGVFLWKKSPRCHIPAGTRAGSKHPKGYRSISFLYKTFKEHNLAFLFMQGKLPKFSEVVDHVNRIRDDNRWKNLRLTDCSGNARNCSKSKRNKSGYKGVHKGSENRYRASITVNNQSIYLGLFVTAEEAALAYNEAAKTYFGEFAALNEDIKPLSGKYANDFLRVTNTTGFVGVVKDKNYNSWRASTKIKGNMIGFGSYNSPAAAAEAYNIGMQHLYGSTVLINKLPEDYICNLNVKEISDRVDRIMKELQAKANRAKVALD